ncbi:MAG TPA: ribbon-helix-helix protein, CopG family [Coriobacteriia bacterium]
MARMIRKQIVIDVERDAALARLAAQRGVSQSELIRQAVDELVTSADEEYRRRKAHAELIEMFKNAPNRGLTDENGKRTWKREDLYGDRGLR